MMNVRELCLLHTDLKSDQIVALEKIFENITLLQMIYTDLKIHVKGKGQKDVLSLHSSSLIRAVLSSQTTELLIKKGKLPICNGLDQTMAVLEFKPAKSRSTLQEIINYIQELGGIIYPDNCLVPDGLLVVNPHGEIKYINCIARLMFERLNISTHNAEAFFELAKEQGNIPEDILNHAAFFCAHFQISQFDLFFAFFPFYQEEQFLGGALILSDLSLIKKKEKELMEKSTVNKEIHHRVKNNLQTITSLLRLQMRRTNPKNVEKVFNESINRILSIALIHEALSKQDLEIINIKQTIYSIVEMILTNMVDPHKTVRGEINGDDVYLSAAMASSVSLCITELIQNVVEHAFTNRKDGVIKITITEKNEEVLIAVEDNGVGISPLKIQSEISLGLEIVKTITKDKLRGEFRIDGSSKGTMAMISFPKSTLKGVD